MDPTDKSNFNSSGILDNYTGNKQVNGLWQWIINRIPPYKIYYELFAGSAAIARNLPTKDPKVIVDCNAGITDALRCIPRLSNAKIICGDAVQILSSVAAAPGATDIFIYMDPPYRFDSRLQKGRVYYKSEFGTDEQHKKLLRAAATVKCSCMISHPENDLYDEYLQGWTKEKYKVSYQGTPAYEWIYYNYPRPDVLHTYDFVGGDCWDRQRVKRKIERLAAKLAALPALERNAVISRAIR